MAVTQQVVAQLRQLGDCLDEQGSPGALTGSAAGPIRAFALHVATLRWRHAAPPGLSWRRLFPRGELGMIDCNTMLRPKIAVSLDAATLARLDRLVARGVFPNRSRAVEQAVAEKLARLERGRLARECANLDPAFEKALAEEGLTSDLGEWPPY